MTRQESSCPIERPEPLSGGHGDEALMVSPRNLLALRQTGPAKSRRIIRTTAATSASATLVSSSSLPTKTPPPMIHRIHDRTKMASTPTRSSHFGDTRALLIWVLFLLGILSLALPLPAVQPTPPAAPSGLVASALSSSQINLSWQDNSTDETLFSIECSATSSGPFYQIATTGAGVTAYSNIGLKAGTIYYYRVRAYNRRGYSSYSNVASASTTSTVT